MKKKDILIILVLFALWVGWPYIDRILIKPLFPQAPARPAAIANTNAVAAGFTNTPPASRTPPALAEAPAPAPVATNVAALPATVAPEPEWPATPEKTAELTNALVTIKVSARGAAVVAAQLHKFRQTADPGSGPVVLDFQSERALAFRDWPGMTARSDYEMTAASDGQTVVFERQSDTGIALRRTLTLTNNYLIRITDEFVNRGAQPATLPALGYQLGPMRNLPGEKDDSGYPSLGADTLSPGGEGVQYWAKSFAKWFKLEQEQKNLPKLPIMVNWTLERPVDWIAIKNKYFAQILTPEGGCDQAIVQVRRTTAPQEVVDPAFKPKMTPIQDVAAAVYFPETVLAPGEKAVKVCAYYVGPKQYSELSRYGLHQVDVMEFGFWRPVGKVLLVIMNAIHDWIWPHSYGLAIMLLTIIIRIVFWPITHKSTESMKKMQAIQPLVMELRAKYKDNPQKQQQEIMALYKEHKVNPLGGCLPMLIQIPVFIALFVVLRSAIELRFSSFLWIPDLSAPERLFANVLPIPLNILPILMAATMAWQQKLTPTGGDPSQQKMMMFMPVIMLVFFYNFASGLSLYWTTNQVLMIVQLLWQKRRQAAKTAGAGTRDRNKAGG